MLDRYLNKYHICSNDAEQAGSKVALCFQHVCGGIWTNHLDFMVNNCNCFFTVIRPAHHIQCISSKE